MYNTNSYTHQSQQHQRSSNTKPSHATTTDPTAAQRTIHIGNLVSTVTEEMLITFFARCGTITNIKLAGNPNYPARFAFIEFATIPQAQTACTLAGTQLAGKALKIAIAKNPITTPYSVNSSNSAAAMPPAASTYGAYAQQPTPATTTYNSAAYYGAQAQTTSPIGQQQQHYGLYNNYTNYGTATTANTTAPSATTAAYGNYATNYAGYGYDMSGAATIPATSYGTTATNMTPMRSSTNISPSASSYQKPNKEALSRTVYVAGVDREVNEQTVLNFFSQCGEISNYRFCMGAPSKFAFIEFATREGAVAAINCSGSVLGSCTLKISFSKSAIQQTGPNKPLPLTVEQQEMVTRTVHIGNLDGHLSEEQIQKYFSDTCGPISRFVMAGGNPNNDQVARFCFIEFQSQQSAQMALNMANTVIGALAIKVSPSRSPILAGGLKKKLSSQNSSYLDNTADVYGATMAANNAYQQYYGQQGAGGYTDYANTEQQQQNNAYYNYYSTTDNNTTATAAGSYQDYSAAYGVQQQQQQQYSNNASGTSTYSETSNTSQQYTNNNNNNNNSTNTNQVNTDGISGSGSSRTKPTRRKRLPSPKTPPESPPHDLFERQQIFFGIKPAADDSSNSESGIPSLKRKRSSAEDDTEQQQEEEDGTKRTRLSSSDEVPSETTSSE